MRESVVLRVAGWDVVGTSHLPRGLKRRVGLLFMNPGHAPRDGHGGLTARACDRLVSRGYPCFRFDMPGLGDTKGGLPEKDETLYDFVSGAGYAPVTAELARELRRRFDLEGLVLGGLCGAAVTAVFVADRHPELVQGLVMFEPQFFTVGVRVPGDDRVAAANDSENPPGRIEAVTSKAFSYWGWMTLLTAENRYAKYLPLPRHVILNMISRAGLPRVANLPLIDAWKRARARGVPTLVITAKGKLREFFFEWVNRVALEQIGTAQMTHQRLEGTNHLFTSGGATARVTGLLEQWCERVFETPREAGQGRAAS